MTNLGAHDLTIMFFALAVLLGAAKLAGELIQKLGQPSILGEISAGILLGPTVLGRFQPHWYAALFPSTGPVPIMIETVATLGVVFFLLVAGLETRLRSIFRQGRRALFVSSFGLVWVCGSPARQGLQSGIPGEGCFSRYGHPSTGEKLSDL